jgi:hypothetical protein
MMVCTFTEFAEVFGIGVFVGFALTVGLLFLAAHLARKDI